MIPTTMNRHALNNACATIIATPASAASGVPMPTSTIRKPSWLTVPNASTSFRSTTSSDRSPASSIEATPRVSTSGCHTGFAANTGASRATRYTPAFTMAAACRYALTGVGAAIAPGSQKCSGTTADLLSAPIRISTTATFTASPPGGCARASRSESR